MKPNSWSRASAIAKELRAAGYIVKMERKKPNPLFVSPELDQATFFMSADEAKARLDAVRLEAKCRELVQLQSLSPEECSKVIKGILNGILSSLAQDMGDDDVQKFNQIMNVVADSCANDFSQKAANVIAKEMAKSGIVTVKELEAIIRFQKGPLGRKQRMLTVVISEPVTKTMIDISQEWAATVLPAKLREAVAGSEMFNAIADDLERGEMFNAIADDLERDGREFLRAKYGDAFVNRMDAVRGTQAQ